MDTAQPTHIAYLLLVDATSQFEDVLLTMPFGSEKAERQVFIRKSEVWAYRSCIAREPTSVVFQSVPIMLNSALEDQWRHERKHRDMGGQVIPFIQMLAFLQILGQTPTTAPVRSIPLQVVTSHHIQARLTRLLRTSQAELRFIASLRSRVPLLARITRGMLFGQRRAFSTFSAIMLDCLEESRLLRQGSGPWNKLRIQLRKAQAVHKNDSETITALGTGLLYLSQRRAWANLEK